LDALLSPAANLSPCGRLSEPWNKNRLTGRFAFPFMVVPPGLRPGPGAVRCCAVTRLLPALCLLLSLAAASAQETAPKNKIIFAPGASQPVITTSGSTAVVAGPSRTAGPDALIASFFGALKAGRVDEAYDGLVKGTVIADRQKDVVALKAKTTEAIEGYGKIGGYELADERWVGNSLMRRTCISLGEVLPLRWRFYFYKAGADWKLVDLRVDDALVELFEESGRPRP